MQKTITAAAVLLLVQVALVVVMNMGKSDLAGFEAGESFLSMAAGEVDTLEISDEGKGNLILKKEGESWSIQSYYAAPAPAGKVEGLVEKIAGLKQGLAVATSESAYKRFKVATADFERHVVLKKGEQSLGDFYVGTSPGFKQVHARKQGAKEVISLALSSFELDTDPENWLDKDLLQLPEDGLAQIVFDDFLLKKEEERWLFHKTNDGNALLIKLQDDDIKGLVTKVSELAPEAVLDPEQGRKLFEGEPALQFRVILSGEKELEYTFVGDEDVFVLKRSDLQYYFKINQVLVENIQKAGREEEHREQTVADPENSGVEIPLKPLE